MATIFSAPHGYAAGASGAQGQGSAASDRAALAALYDATDGWKSDANWKTDKPLADWYGVSTNNAGRVVSLDLDDNGLTGEIPRELGGLTYLESLFLGNNRLTGEIPRELGGLTNLEWLFLGSNGLTGGIPRELGGLTNLEWLFLERNGLTGGIPQELGGLTNLESLELHNNHLTGEIPRELGGLTKLEYLRSQRDGRVLSVEAGPGRWARIFGWRTSR